MHDARQHEEDPGEGGYAARRVSDDRAEPERKDAEDGYVEACPDDGPRHAGMREGDLDVLTGKYRLTNKEATSTAGTISTRVTPAKTPAFAHSTGRRRGTAKNEERIMPVEYSALMTSTPRTPMANWAKLRPTMLASRGLKFARSAAGMPVQWLTMTADATAASPIVKMTAARSAYRVERTERSFVHSERNTRRWVTRIVAVRSRGSHAKTSVSNSSTVVSGSRTPQCHESDP